MVHVVATGKERVGPVSCETDRARFLGRGRSTRDPVALESDGALSGTTGAVLDPIFALRARVRLRPGQSASVAFTTLVATTRERAFELAGRYHDPHAAQRALDLAWTATQVELRELGLTPADAAVFQELAGHLFFSNPAIRASQDELRRNRGSRQRLWAHGVSGDWPIVLATIDSTAGLPTHPATARGAPLLAPPGHDGGRRGAELAADELLPGAAQRNRRGGLLGRRRRAARPVGRRVRSARDLLGAEDLLMLRATARVHIPCDGRSLGRLLERRSRAPEQGRPVLDERAAAVSPRSHPRLWERKAVERGSRSTVEAPPEQVAVTFDNGYGGLTAEGDYRYRVRSHKVPPAPWTNVIANRSGGFIVSERGAGFTWAENSYFFRLTPWHNDPVTDPVTETIYLRDDETGEVWGATPAPTRHDAAFTVRHSAGTSTFRHQYAGIATELTLGMAGEEPVKVSLLRLTNADRRRRRLTVTAYAEWTLGVQREHTQHQVCTSYEAAAAGDLRPQLLRSGVRRPGGVSGHQRAGHELHRRPARIHRPQRDVRRSRRRSAHDRLSGTTGAGIDPCAALQCVIELAPGESREMVVILGAVSGENEARRVVAEYRQVARAKAAMDELGRGLGGDGCRSFRYARPTRRSTPCSTAGRCTRLSAAGCGRARRSIRAAAPTASATSCRTSWRSCTPSRRWRASTSCARRPASFVEGDVQHWWHPQSGRGVRTRFSDDLAWLPYVVDHYVRVSGDASVLDEMVPFLAMRPLEPHEHEVYDLPGVTEEQATVYEHCLRALRKALHDRRARAAAHRHRRLERRDESGRAWRARARACGSRGSWSPRSGSSPTTPTRAATPRWPPSFARRPTRTRARSRRTAWDGAWYRRAYFDDGTPLGSAAERRVPHRFDRAELERDLGRRRRPSGSARPCASLEEHLVREDARLLMLLTPPFDRDPARPGLHQGLSARCP